MVLDCFAACAGTGCACLCARQMEDDDEEAAMERKALVSGSSQVVRLRDLVVEGMSGTRTLGFHLEPKVRYRRSAWNVPIRDQQHVIDR